MLFKVNKPRVQGQLRNDDIWETLKGTGDAKAKYKNVLLSCGVASVRDFDITVKSPHLALQITTWWSVLCEMFNKMADLAVKPVAEFPFSTISSLRSFPGNFQEILQTGFETEVSHVTFVTIEITELWTISCITDTFFGETEKYTW